MLDFSSATVSHPGGFDFPPTPPAFLLLTEWVRFLYWNTKALAHCLLPLSLPGVLLCPAPGNAAPPLMAELLHPEPLVT